MRPCDEAALSSAGSGGGPAFGSCRGVRLGVGGREGKETGLLIQVKQERGEHLRLFFFSTRRAPIIAAVNCVSLKVIGSYGAVFSFPAGRQWLSAVLNVNQRVSAETCAVGSRRNGFTPAAPRSPQYSAAPGRERAGVPLRKRSCRRTWKALNRDGGGGLRGIVLLLGTVAQPRSARTGTLDTASQGRRRGGEGHPAASRALCLAVASSAPGGGGDGPGPKGTVWLRAPSPEEAFWRNVAREPGPAAPKPSLTPGPPRPPLGTCTRLRRRRGRAAARSPQRTRSPPPSPLPANNRAALGRRRLRRAEQTLPDYRGAPRAAEGRGEPSRAVPSRPDGRLRGRPRGPSPCRSRGWGRPRGRARCLPRGAGPPLRRWHRVTPIRAARPPLRQSSQPGTAASPVVHGNRRI